MFSSYYMDRTGHIYPNQATPDARRVAVVDPEDREQVEAICKAFVAAGVWKVIPADVEDLHGHRRDQIADALREFADPKPPRPDEPTGLGAVVRGSDGRIWIRAVQTAIGDMHWRSEDGQTCAKWRGIDAVEVLSEGVQP
jgi:hypothetical protein